MEDSPIVNPYTSVSISGYNVDPPPNDASEVSNNQLDWVLQHKAKLGDPLKTAIESINTNVANAFGKRFGTTFETKSTNYNIAAPGDQGKFFEVIGATTITLPAAVDAGDGFDVAIINNGSATVTVDGNASELINGSTSITLDANDALVITCDGSSWVGFIIRANVITVENGSFTANWTGFSAAQSTVINFTRVGKQVTMHFNTVLSATSNATDMSSAAGEVPASLRPSEAAVIMPTAVRDNGTLALGVARVTTAGALELYPNVLLGNFTASGSKGHGLEFCFTYLLD